jgi:ubiquinone/menaquinone biosynthesis C-methylase UbiE
MSTRDPSAALSLQQQATTWDAVAPTYAQAAWQWLDYAAEALRIVPPEPTHRVLDLATGPGTLAFGAAARAARVDAVDFSPGMISELKARAVREGVANVEGAVMDVHALAFPDASFDVEYCLFAFFFFPDRARVFREMHRVLKPGGRALIATWAPIERRPLMKLGFEAMAEAMPQLPRPAKGDLQEPEECVREMSAAGFRDVVARPFAISLHFESAEKYRDLVVCSAAPLAAIKQKLGPDAWGAAMARLIEALRARIPAGGVSLSAEAILTVGSR